MPSSTWQSLKQQFQGRLALSGQNHSSPVGIPVALNRHPSKTAPTLTTTCEAIVGLLHSNFPLQGTVLKFAAAADSLYDQSGSTRQTAWYLLSLVHVFQRNQDPTHREHLSRMIVSVTEVLLQRQHEEGSWPDEAHRNHPVYSTWIASWALLELYQYAKTGTQEAGTGCALNEDMTRQLEDALRKALKYLQFEPATGTGFTKETTELPNSAMTAYVLFLLGKAAVFGFTREAKLREHMEGFKFLATAAEGRVWNSIRELYGPDSEEPVYEHFTTCWVARAALQGLEAARKKLVDNDPLLIRTLARALQGMEELSSQQEGLIAVDVGAPSDFSFALADALMLFGDLGSQASDLEAVVSRLWLVAEIERHRADHLELALVWQQRQSLATLQKELLSEFEAGKLKSETREQELRTREQQIKKEEKRIKDAEKRLATVSGFDWTLVHSVLLCSGGFLGSLSILVKVSVYGAVSLTYCVSALAVLTALVARNSWLQRGTRGIPEGLKPIHVLVALAVLDLVLATVLYVWIREIGLRTWWDYIEPMNSFLSFALFSLTIVFAPAAVWWVERRRDRGRSGGSPA